MIKMEYSDRIFDRINRMSAQVGTKAQRGKGTKQKKIVENTRPACADLPTPAEAGFAKAGAASAGRR